MIWGAFLGALKQCGGHTGSLTKAEPPLAEPTGTNFNLELQEQRVSGSGGGTSLSKAQAGVWLTFRPPAPTAWKLCSHLWA